MKYLKLTRLLAIITIVAVVFTACKKTKLSTPMGDAGQTLVKIINGGTPASLQKKPVDFVPTPTRLLVVELRRDIPNETELNKTMVVTVKDDTAAVKATNPGYIHLPTAWYTLNGWRENRRTRRYFYFHVCSGSIFKGDLCDYS